MVPVTVSNPVRACRVLQCGQAFVFLPDAGAIRISGPDRLRFLNSLTSQKLDDAVPGVSYETLLLDARGRIEQQIFLVDDGVASYLLYDRVARADGFSLFRFLVGMRFTMRVDFTDLAESHATLVFFAGGDVERVLAAYFAAGTDAVHTDAAGRDASGGDVVRSGASAVGDAVSPLVWCDPWPNVQAGGAGYAASPHPGQGWGERRLLVERAHLSGLLTDFSRAQILEVGSAALTTLRIAAFRPALPAGDAGHCLPHEFDWLRTAVHLQKGCYRGQETVAKVHNVGHPPRRLVLLHLEDGSAAFECDFARVFLPGVQRRECGRVVASGLHHELGGVALALVKRTVAEDAVLELDCSVNVGGLTGSAAGDEVVEAVPGGVAAGVRGAVRTVLASQQVIVPKDTGAFAVRGRDMSRVPGLSRAGARLSGR